MRAGYSCKLTLLPVAVLLSPLPLSSTSIMATKSVEVVLVVGKNKIPVNVSTSHSPWYGYDYLTVRDLSEAVHQHTNIKPENQKLIYRGRTLFKTYDPSDDALKLPLSSLGVKHGDRIMVFGKPSIDEKAGVDKDPRLDELMTVLDQHQAKIDDICLLCSQMVDTMGKNSRKPSVEDLKKHKKFFLGQSEYSMQELTRLDATPGDLAQHQDYKTRRKALVNRLLENITLCDNQVSTLTTSIQEVEGKHS